MIQPSSYITTDPLPHPAMDFNFLRQEGIKYISQLAGHIWTDYNVHDPGITILEQVCYAITDLSYRINFDIPDILADDKNPYKSLYRASEILTTKPVTLLDFRKLLLDINGVKNAWVEIVKEQQPNLYFTAEPGGLSTIDNGQAENVHLKGLYRVLIQLDERRAGEGAAIMNEVLDQLHNHRNLGEDFEGIRILEPQPIHIEADIEIGEVNEPERLLAEIYDKIANYISPSIPRYSLSQLFSKGKSIDEVLDGPPLKHGFIDSNELAQFTRRQELRSSDIIRGIMDVPGVKAVRKIILISGQQKEAWLLELDNQKVPQFRPSSPQTKITLYKDSVSANLNSTKVQQYYDSLRDREKIRPLPEYERDIIPEKRRRRNIEDYYSIQHHFPALYGIGELGLPESASPKRKAQAQQLKAYLLFFDQLLASYFSQLAHTKSLFSFEEGASYFTQAIEDIPGVETLLNNELETHREKLKDIIETPTEKEERKNRLLDHLMARFCEQFTEYSMILFEQENKLMKDKIAFLKDYPQLSSGRSTGFNYKKRTSTSDAWNTDNVAGLKIRLCRMLGIETIKRTNLAEGEKEGFHLVEHILLRPYKEDIFQEGELLENFQTKDPYSLQLSFMLPNWTGRFLQEEFRKFVEKTFREETPAHLSIYIHWLDRGSMNAFEIAYKDWLEKIGK